MKLNSSKSIETAAKVFRSYDGSWTAARKAAQRDPDGVLVIPKKVDREIDPSPVQKGGARGALKAG